MSRKFFRYVPVANCLHDILRKIPAHGGGPGMSGKLPAIGSTASLICDFCLLKSEKLIPRTRNKSALSCLAVRLFAFRPCHTIRPTARKPRRGRHSSFLIPGNRKGHTRKGYSPLTFVDGFLIYRFDRKALFRITPRRSAPSRFFSLISPMNFPVTFLKVARVSPVESVRNTR